jgi:flagellar assembly protein FliH
VTTASSRARSYQRFIPSEEVGKVAQWSFDAVDEAERMAAALAASHDDGSLQAKYNEGYQEGYAEGHAQGRAEAAAEAEREMQDYLAGQGRETAQRLAELTQALEARLADAEQRVADGVLELACALARQVVRQELAANPNALQPVVREAIGMLMADGRSAVVRLNPADMDVVEQPLREEFSTLALTWMADAAVAPGGCLVESAGAVVDGSLEKRWLRAIANLGLQTPWEPEPQDEH